MNRGHCCDRSGVCVWLLAMLSVLAPIDVLAANRVALVVGNSGYEDAPLRNPSRDADDISSVLKQLGFQVATHKDVTKQQFEDAVDTVTRGLGGGDVCLIFYAGHGMQLDEENYLVPVGAKVDEPQHVEQRCVKVNYLLSALKYSDCSLKIVVVDACRNNPFRGFRRSTAGLAELREAPEGTIVSFSTSPKTAALDGKGSNSPFAKHLVATLKTQAKTSHIVDVFLKTSRAVRQETGQRPFLRMDASMPEFFLGASDIGMVPQIETTNLKSEISNSIGMTLKLIPAGDFLMGSPTNEKFHEDEALQHRVRITKPFYMQTTEVTQKQWLSVMGTRAWQAGDTREGDDYPAIAVSWDDAAEFCRKLSLKEGTSYRLPTEAEWEYACRAGSRKAYSFGDSVETLDRYAWYGENSNYDSHEVGMKMSNGFGLFDMHGNVWEWCSDWYASDYYRMSSPDDPEGPSSGEWRVCRGGDCLNAGPVCRSAGRMMFSPSDPDWTHGFRVARSSVE